jgi:hypothetical protein
MTEAIPQCPLCKHRSKRGCPVCGGAQGFKGLPPCPACPSGTVIGQEADDTLDAPSIASWTETVERYDFFGVDSVPNHETLASIAAANDARIQSIAMTLRAYPERIGQVETLLNIPMGS